MKSEAIKMIMVKRDLNGKKLADILECSPQNVYNLLKKDNFTEEQLCRIADALNCDLEINLVLRDTKEKF